MKFEDANDLSEISEVQTDICIVGAGAAGISLALSLANSGLDVLVLESGGLKPDSRIQSLYAGSVEEARLHSPPDRYRQRRFGGTTSIWGGRCMPFDAIDFERRDYVAHSGWPIVRADLDPYYPRANGICEAGSFDYTVESAFQQTLPPMVAGFESRDFTTNTLERFSRPTDFGRRYARELQAAPNIRLLTHANLTGLTLDSAGKRVQAATVKTLQNRIFNVRAARFALAAGGIENARLLLANDQVQLNGVGNDHGVVGRYYMCHIAGTIGRISIDGPLSTVHHGYDKSAEGIYCRRRFALTADSQRRRGLGNFIARLHHPRITDPAHRSGVLSLLYLAKPIIPFEYATRLHGDEAVTLGLWLRHARNVAVAPFDSVQFAWHILRDRILATRKFPSIIVKSRANLFSLDFHGEQEPNADSRIALGSERDALGTRKVHIDWRYTPNDVHTIKTSIALLKADIERSRVGRFEYDPDQVEQEMTRYGAYGGHHIGTTRMGTDRSSSVVDPNCRVHGIDNLFIAGASVFPTSSQANPTLTIVAMALRLADHLRNA